VKKSPGGGNGMYEKFRKFFFEVPVFFTFYTKVEKSLRNSKARISS
jgi:hypothetical protein